MSGNSTAQGGAPSKTPPRAANGWDGKLRINQEEDDDEDDNNDEQSDAEEDTGAEGFPSTEIDGAEIDADEDLLDEIPEDETDIDLNHCRISSVSSLRLERFPNLERLCLRQNHITHADFPSDWGTSLQELDLYDNSLSHIKGLNAFPALTSLDLSFNNIKHIKRLEHLTSLTDIYFVQNRITRIENLDALVNITNLELAANRIRDIENLDNLQKLQQLWLGKNKITTLQNLAALSNLTLLSVQSNRITSDSLGHLAELPALEELYISHNALTHLRPLADCVALRTLDVSSNGITSVEGLAPLAELEELWASDCKLESFEELGSVLADKKNLSTVYFEGNPLQTRRREVYRNKVRLALPQVGQIDATAVRAS